MSERKLSEIVDIYFYKQNEDGTREIVLFLENVDLLPSKEVDKAIEKETVYVKGTIKNKNI